MENGHVHLHVMNFGTIDNVKNLKIKKYNSSFLQWQRSIEWQSTKGLSCGSKSNHSNHAILVECHNITMVVYQIVLDKWSMDFANDNYWSNFVAVQPKSPLELFYPKAMCHHKWCNTHNVQQLIIFYLSKSWCV